MPWTLRALRDLGGRAHLDALYKRLGQLLRIPEDLLWLEHPPEAEQEDYVVRHRMRLDLTDLKHLGLVHSLGEGMWSLTEQGSDFLRLLEKGWKIPSRPRGHHLRPPDIQADLLKRLLKRPKNHPIELLARYRWQLREQLVASGAIPDSPDTLIAGFEGTCVICEEPINIGDTIAISFQDASLNVEGWRHDRCSRRGPGGAAVPAWVPKPGNPPKESAVRRRLFPTEGDD
jgi:hypothetical protein